MVCGIGSANNIMVQVANKSLHLIEHLRACLIVGISRAVFNSVNLVVSLTKAE
jgi:hypothetical protein